VAARIVLDHLTRLAFDEKAPGSEAVSDNEDGSFRTHPYFWAAFALVGSDQ